MRIKISEREKKKKKWRREDEVSSLRITISMTQDWGERIKRFRNKMNLLLLLLPLLLLRRRIREFHRCSLPFFSIGDEYFRLDLPIL